MLKLKNVVKTYQAADLKVVALKGISICFRRNEFVSILGPSGCGKTTLLNVIGGLDHYDEGDLVINGKSTHDFSEREWDVYRNHRIGFIFQSYNLIPQSTILENVELALTIAGLKKEERVKKAMAALAKVGLEGMERKHPNQLSGGQCQRVAIARALVNEPEILLADEPTGALDSVTSIQVMDLIKEIAKEKLVIMVTHNPDLAKQYSTRIVTLKDGLLEEDSSPYSEEDEAKEREEQATPIANEKAKMSWWTAFKLSAKNLATKAKRTALTVVAASIGIVGVSAVLAVSNGISEYIVSIQDDLLSGNPVYVATSSLDLSALMNTVTALGQSRKVAQGVHDGKIDVDFLVEELMNLSTSTISNDISEDYIRFLEQMPPEYYAAMSKSYGVDLTNNIYTNTKINISDTAEEETVFSLRGMTGYCETILRYADDGKFASFASLVSTLTSVLRQSIDNKEYVLNQYDILDTGGKFAENEDELMLVLNHDQETTDLVMTMLGYYSQADFETDMDYHVAVRDKAMTPELQAKYDAIKSVSIETIKAKEFTYYPNDTVYKKLYTDGVPLTYAKPFEYNHKADPAWNTGMKMKISGILAPKKGTQYGCLRTGLYYTPKFVQRVLADASQSNIVKFLPTYREAMASTGTSVNGYISMPNQNMGVLYKLHYYFRGSSGDMTLSVGSSSGISDITVLSNSALGGRKLPSRIDVYPKSFNDKYQVTDYLDQWNGKDPITLKATDKYEQKVLTAEERTTVKYNDNLEVVIFMINSIIQIITVALIAFTSLSLVVSTVMIAIITYVSVMERIKEIGVIRALGGRKRDVSHLFNAETFIIGSISGLFGLVVTYLLQGLLNFIMYKAFDIGVIANLNFFVAAIVLVIAIALTMIAGLIPSASAAKKDPVVALRTE